MRIPLLSLVLCACAQTHFAPKPDRHSADAAVYRAVLDSVIVAARPRPTQLVVIDSTYTGRWQDAVVSGLPGVDSGVVTDFDERNRESHSLEYLATPDISVPVVLVSRHTLQSFLTNGPEPYWSEFYRRYPGRWRVAVIQITVVS